MNDSVERSSAKCNSTECNFVEETYYWKNRDMILNRAKNHYKNDKKISREHATDKCRNLSGEERNEKRNMEEADITIFLKKRNKD